MSCNWLQFNSLAWPFSGSSILRVPASHFLGPISEPCYARQWELLASQRLQKYPLRGFCNAKFWWQGIAEPIRPVSSQWMAFTPLGTIMSASSSSNDSLHVKSMLCRYLFPKSMKLRFDGKRAFSRVIWFWKQFKGLSVVWIVWVSDSSLWIVAAHEKASSSSTTLSCCLERASATRFSLPGLMS